MTWSKAGVLALAIFLYFVLATVWLPDFILGFDSVAGASSFVRDAIALVVWGVPLIAGLWALRRAQSRGII